MPGVRIHLECLGGLRVSFRNPKDDEKRALNEEAAQLCRDCGDSQVKGGENSVIMPCGHVAHPDCHVTDGSITCPYGGTVDPERVNDYEEISSGGGD